MMIISAIINVIIISIIWYLLSGVWWLSTPFFGKILLLYEMTYLIGGFTAWFIYKGDKLFKLSILIWTFINILFSIILILNQINSDTNTLAWIYLFIIGQVFVSIIPIIILSYFINRILKFNLSQRA